MIRRRAFTLGYNNVNVVNHKVIEFWMILANSVGDCKVGLVSLRSS